MPSLPRHRASRGARGDHGLSLAQAAWAPPARRVASRQLTCTAQRSVPFIRTAGAAHLRLRYGLGILHTCACDRLRHQALAGAGRHGYSRFLGGGSARERLPPPAGKVVAASRHGFVLGCAPHRPVICNSTRMHGARGMATSSCTPSGLACGAARRATPDRATRRRPLACPRPRQPDFVFVLLTSSLCRLLTPCPRPLHAASCGGRGRRAAFVPGAAACDAATL